jgi:hypothetical protein
VINFVSAFALHFAVVLIAGKPILPKNELFSGD